MKRGGYQALSCSLTSLPSTLLRTSESFWLMACMCCGYSPRLWNSLGVTGWNRGFQSGTRFRPWARAKGDLIMKVSVLFFFSSGCSSCRV